MPLIPIEFTENIHEGKVYSLAWTYTNSGSTSITYQSYIKWVADKINALLNSLPDGYYMEIIRLGGGVVSNPFYSTAGTSHNVSVVTFYTDVNATGGMAMYINRFNSTLANSHRRVIGFNYTSGAVAVSDYDERECIAPGNDSSTAIYYRLVKHIYNPTITE